MLIEKIIAITLGVILFACIVAVVYGVIRFRIWLKKDYKKWVEDGCPNSTNIWPR